MKHRAAAALCVGLAASLACGDERADADGVVLRVDADGWFVVEAAPEGELWEGTGVRCILASPGDRGRRPLAGRLAPGAERPVVWVREPGGRLDAHEARLVTEVPSLVGPAPPSMPWSLVRRGVPTPLPPGGGTLWSDFASLVTEAIRQRTYGEPPPAASPERPGACAVRSTPPVRQPSEGAPLEEWVPSGCVSVRFRSVEAAYRFSSEADRLCAALLLAQGDARDYGSLRLVLHDLLLPTIWRTNPDAERGVSELMVVLEPGVDRGRLRTAVVFRVVDADLHDMQTRAGIALESKPDHAWKPAADPFPEERERRNFRRRVADVEIVATDAVLLDRVAAAGAGELDRQPAWSTAIAESRGVSPQPAADEAALYVRGLPFSPSLEFGGVRRSGFREELGLLELVRTWTGLRVPWRSYRLSEVEAAPPAGLWSARWVQVRTDVAGALVRARYDDEGAAASAAAALRAAAEPRDGTDACLRNLRDLVPLALVERAENDLAERCFVVLGWRPVCPSGGAYSAHPITREVSCSAHGTEKSPRAAPARAVPLSDITVDGRDVTFRWKIDWSRKE